MHVLTHALFLTGFASAPLPTTATATSSWTWDPLDLHLFVDFDGLSMADNVSPIQHRPSYTNELIVKPDRPWDGGSRGGDRGYIHPYVGTVQVSPTELRIYYFGEGSGVRTLCVAVSLDAGATWSKPSLGLVRFEGSTANNIIAAGAPLGFLGSADIAAGTVFIDENPRVLPHERFKMVLHWKSGDAMFASPDGFRFQNMTAGPLLTGSDTQSVVFYSKHIDDGSYVYFGRSHLRGGQSESCSKSIVAPSSKVVEPSRSVNHFVIGADVTHWPYHTSDGNGTQDRCVLNTDENDPPCMDLYTSSATPVGDAIFLFPMMYNHFDDVYSHGRRDGSDAPGRHPSSLGLQGSLLSTRRRETSREQHRCVRRIVRCSRNSGRAGCFPGCRGNMAGGNGATVHTCRLRRVATATLPRCRTGALPCPIWPAVVETAAKWIRVLIYPSFQRSPGRRYYYAPIQAANVRARRSAHLAAEYLCRDRPRRHG
jgi:hypothetical protein